MRSVDNRGSLLPTIKNMDRDYSISERIFLVLKNIQDLEGSSALEQSVSSGSIRILRKNGEDANSSSRVVVEVSSDLEGADVADELRKAPTVQDVFPVLQTASGEIHPARLNTIVILLELALEH